MFIYVFAIFTVSCCYDSNSSINNAQILKNTIFDLEDRLSDSLIFDINETFQKDSLIEKVFFIVKKFGYVEGLGEENNEFIEGPRIVLYGYYKNHKYNADIHFVPDGNILPSPIYSKNDSLFRATYHFSRVNQIVEMLENHKYVVCHYRKYRDSGIWFDFHYNKEQY